MANTLIYTIPVPYDIPGILDLHMTPLAMARVLESGMLQVAYGMTATGERTIEFAIA